MTIQMTVDLTPKKVYQYLLRYFKFNKSIDVKNSEPSYILLRAGGYWDKEYASSNVEIKIHPERNETLLTLNFSFREYFLTALMFGALALTIIWAGPIALWSQTQPYQIIGSTVLSIIILIYFVISVPFGIRKTKRKFLDDIREALDLLNKTD